MRLLVTGGAGFIGSNFVSHMLDRDTNDGYSVTVLDSLTYAGNLRNLEKHLSNPKFNFVQGDIRDEKIVRVLTKDADIVINFAAESHVDRSIEDASNFVSTNVLGTYNLLEHSRSNGVEKFIQISTDEVYGSINEGNWTEDSLIQPNSPYSASKASADLIARSYFKTYNFGVMVTRCSNNYGPFQHIEKFIPASITNIISGKDIRVYGNGLNVRDWIHVKDHCSAIEKVMHFGKAGGVFNIGGSNELTNIYIANEICRLMGVSADRIDFVEDRKGHDFRYSVDSNLISGLGFRLTTEFNSGLLDTIKWYKENISWWKSN
jgi:dTDP-glucose 4,6-dehydratase